MNPELPVINIEHLSKRYGGSSELALNKLSLHINSGEVYGFLGPNGAGKSTTLRLLLNFLQPTSGSAQILGKDIVLDSLEIKKSVGYLAGDVALYLKATGRQFLNYMEALQPTKTAGYRKDLVKRFGATLNRPLDDLSKGNRQKLGIIQAFMHEPKVLILDEPTSGLDPLMQEQFFELIKEAKARGAAVLVSSHNLAEVRRMCDRIGFIRNGRLISEQSIAELASSATQTFDIVFEAAVPAEELRKIKGCKLSLNSGNHATVRLAGDLSPLFAVLSRHRVHTISQREVDLEEEFLKFYKGART